MFLILWRLNWVLTLVSLAVVPPLVLVFRRYAGPMTDLSYRQQEVDSQMYAFVERTLAAIPVVQAFAREDAADHEFHNRFEASRSAAMRMTRVQLRFKFLVALVTATGTAAILWLGAHQVLDGALTVGGILVFLSYLASLYAPLEALVYTSSTVQSVSGSARRVIEVLETTPDVTDRPGAIPLDTVRGDVSFDAVTCGYDPGRPVLHGVTLHVPAGQTVAVVGPSGVGKTTLLSLIPRFYDTWSGQVRIDGVDVRDVRLESLRRHISIVLQEPLLFPMSVEENIAYGRPGAPPEAIERCARAANAHEFILRLPDGYDTVIGERGATLSGGERQRIAIARALLKDAPILILDEPTSAVDATTEALLVEALRRLMRERTTFLIAHRLSTVRHADRIVVLESGQIVESGTHEELIRQNGAYARWSSLQQVQSPTVERGD
jgi:ATP-binding cassette subfamily B protein/subfamily B ATP-binding cassette protein MsbA